MTMPYEPPSGGPDLASQTEYMSREEVARLRADHDAEGVLIRARRDREDRAAETSYPTIRVSSSAMPPAVIDPDGTEYELGPDGMPQQDGEGKPIPAGEYDRTSDGLVVLDSEGHPVPPWPYDEVELHGRMIQVRKPDPAALTAFSMGVSKHTPVRMRNEMVALFVSNHISERSYGELLVAMVNPDDPFTMESFGELMQKIATLGTGRPTPPSQR